MEFKLKNVSSVLEVPRIANVHFFEFERDYETKEDAHSFCEMIFSYAGTLKVHSEKYTGKLRRGELLIHGPNERHSLRVQKNKKNTVVVIGFECRSEVIRPFSEQPIRLDDNEKKQIARIVKEGRNVFAPPYDVPLYDMKKKDERDQIYGSEQLLRSLLETFLIELVRRHVFYKTEEESDVSRFRFDEILSYVDAHFTDKITLDELAFLFNTNRSAFCREFKERTGKTFISYVADKKLDSIKRRLCDTGASLAEIANELNFESVAYLCRFFKKHTGKTPKEYKKFITGN